ncbi:MAG: HD domain-containing protein [Chloroflexi bacterium]|nr:HD domain-containing protein [Chloroflexota bacterium]
MLHPIEHPGMADLRAALAAMSPAALSTVERAFGVAEQAHHGQLRDEGAPFIEHPLRVALIVARELGRSDADLLAAALLHDVVEDSSVREADVRLAFGHQVAHLVGLLTKEKVHDPQAKRAATRRYLKRIADASPEALLLKLCDRLDNLRSLDAIPDYDKRNKYVRETYWLYMPFAERGGEFFRRQYLDLMAATVRRDGELIDLRLADYPELTGGIETRRDPT